MDRVQRPLEFAGKSKRFEVSCLLGVKGLNAEDYVEVSMITGLTKKTTSGFFRQEKTIFFGNEDILLIKNSAVS